MKVAVCLDPAHSGGVGLPLYYWKLTCNSVADPGEGGGTAPIAPCNFW